MASHSLVSRPSTTTAPDVGRRSRLTSLRTVVFPAPLRPTMASISPDSTERFRRFSTSGRPAYRKPTSWNRTSMASGYQLHGLGEGEIKPVVVVDPPQDRLESRPLNDESHRGALVL